LSIKPDKEQFDFCNIEITDITKLRDLYKGRIELHTKGLSMMPLIEEGSTIAVECVSPDKIKIGDVIVFKASDKLVSHRVLKKIKLKGEYYFKEKGDNNMSSTLVKSDDVFGKVVYVYMKEHWESSKSSKCNSGNLKKIIYGIRADSFPARILGLLLSLNDQVVKPLNSYVIYLKEKAIKSFPLMKYSFAIFILSIRYYKFLCLKTGKLLYYLTSRKKIKLEQ